MGVTKKKLTAVAPIFLGLSLLFGQIIRIPLFGGTIFVHDIALFFLVFMSSCLFIFQKEKHQCKNRILTAPVSYFVLAALISIAMHWFGTKDMGSMYGLLYTVRYVYYFFAYLMIFRLSTPHYWLLSLYVTGTASSVAGLIQYSLYPDLRNLMYLGWDPHYQRLFGIFFDPNFAGIFIVLTFLLGLYFLLSSKKKWAIALFQSVNIIALVLTFSRSSYVAAIGGVVALLVFSSHKKVIASFLVGLALLFIIIPTPLGGMFSSMRQTSALARFSNWQESIVLIKTSPLVGHGFYLLQNKKDVMVNEKRTGIPSMAGAVLDNSLLFVFATTGILGFISFLYVLTTMFILGNKMAKTKKVFSSIYKASLVAVILHSLFVNSLFYPWVVLWIWILSGAGEKTNLRPKT